MGQNVVDCAKIRLHIVVKIRCVFDVERLPPPQQIYE